MPPDPSRRRLELEEQRHHHPLGRRRNPDAAAATLESQSRHCIVRQSAALWRPKTPEKGSFRHRMAAKAAGKDELDWRFLHPTHPPPNLSLQSLTYAAAVPAATPELDSPPGGARRLPSRSCCCTRPRERKIGEGAATPGWRPSTCSPPRHSFAVVVDLHVPSTAQPPSFPSFHLRGSQERRLTVMVTLSAERMTVSKKVSYGFPAMVITRMVVVICKATLWVLEAIVLVTAVTNNVIPRIRKLDQHPPLLMSSKRSSRRFRYSLWVPSLQLLFPTEMINGSPRICNLGLYVGHGHSHNRYCDGDLLFNFQLTLCFPLHSHAFVFEPT
nr:hypothetical protein Iba_chr06dCG4820 [Ipomoea batatas]